MLQGKPGIGFALPSAFQGLPFGTTTTNPDGTITTGAGKKNYVNISEDPRTTTGSLGVPEHNLLQPQLAASCQNIPQGSTYEA
jgi:hypothetical protein